MKRPAALLVFICLATTVFAADTQRYLIGTKRPVKAGAIAALRANVDVEPRNVAAFESFDGFAAELTAGEAEALRKSGEIRWIEPVVERNAYLTGRNPTKQSVPYGIKQVGAIAAHQTRKSGDVNVVVVDTGLDFNHPELKAIFAGGFNVLTDTDAVMDDNGHGTHVAGTIAAADNSAGVLGVAPNVRLWSVKMLDASGKGSSEGLIKSIDWVSAQKDARGGNWVVNMSLGADQESIGEREAFQRAADRGILTFAAAGNASTPGNPAPIGFPAALPTVAAVAAVDSSNNVAYFSCQGPDMEIAAPGMGILSTLPVGTDSVAYALVGDDFFPAIPLTGSRMGLVNADFVHCGLGKPEQIPATVKGKIALIQRGELKFAEKARNAIAAGAIAVAIYNNEGGSTATAWTLISDAAGQNFDWPVVLRLEKEDGDKLAALGSGTMKFGWEADDYGHKSGTSMACPHAAGAAALLWTLAPNATATQVLETLKATALDLGDPGQDSVYGAGAIDVFSAAKRLAPESFGGITTGRPLGKRNGRR